MKTNRFFLPVLAFLCLSITAYAQQGRVGINTTTLKMKNKILQMVVLLIGGVLFGQVGINTTTPSSTLDINGSIEGNFREITGTYTVTGTDYHISFSGTSDAVLNLPTKSLIDKSSGDFRGRKYFIKNNSGSNTLTITASFGQIIRFGGSKSDANTYILKPGNFALITASGANGWDMDLIASTSNTNWILNYSDLNGIVSTPQTLSNIQTYYTVNFSKVRAIVPPGISDSRVVLNFTGWGDITCFGAGIGSFRFRLVQTGQSSTTYNSIMMSSWATTNSTNAEAVRYNFPVVYSIAGLPAGTYDFEIQVQREGELGTAPNSVRLFGVQASSNVYIKE